MQVKGISRNSPGYPFGMFMLFLVCGLVVFFISLTFTGVIPKEVRIISKLSLITAFLVSAVLLYRSRRLNKYWKVFFAFFTVSTAIFLGLHSSKLGLRIFNLEINTLNGITLSKLLEDLIIVFIIIALIKISRDDMDSVYISKENLKFGLIIGLVTFLGLFLLSALITSQNISFSKFISLVPSILIIALADGFMEELLFRGLFLKRFEPFVGAGLSNLLTALLYSLAHLQVTFTPNLPIFLIATFLFGLLWGYITQKTRSIWASALFHAGVDTLIMIDFFKGFGIL